MQRMLFLFGLLVFLGSAIVLIMSFFGDDDGLALLIAVFGLLNGGIAMGVSEILGEVKKRDSEN